MASVFVAGQAVLDFVFDVETLPDRAEKYRAHDAQIVGGGCAANAAVAIARLGGHACLASRIGGDPVGKLILEGLRDEGVDVSMVGIAPHGRSSFSSICVDRAGERQIVNVRGRGMEDRFDWKLDKPGAVLADTRWIAGALRALEMARQWQIPGILDGEAPIAAELAAMASHIAFSVQGLRDFTGEADPAKGLETARKKTDAWLAVTEGSNGIHYFEDGRLAHMPSFKVDVVDTLGAGDVWHGAFALRLAEGADEREAMRFASAVAALKCTRLGGRSGTPDRAETEAFLRE